MNFSVSVEVLECFHGLLNQSRDKNFIIKALFLCYWVANDCHDVCKRASIENVHDYPHVVAAHKSGVLLYKIGMLTRKHHVALFAKFSEREFLKLVDVNNLYRHDFSLVRALSDLGSPDDAEAAHADNIFEFVAVRLMRPYIVILWRQLNHFII